MLKKVILIGCGNIGSRHLQALAKIKYDLLVEIVEPNEKAQVIGKLRLNQIRHNKSKHEYFWYKSISELKNKSDLVIIATNSKSRIDQIQQMLEMGNKRFMVEKIVCQSEEEYKNLLLLMKKFHAKGWVNTNRRYFKIYQKIKKNFKDSKFLQVSIFSGNSGLGTNAIHYLDLFSWLVDNYKIKLDGQFLTNKLFKNKRGNDFKEFLGTIIGHNRNGVISLTFFPGKDEFSLVNIYDKDKFACINELKEEAYFVTRKKGKELKFKFVHTSDMTTKVAQDIFTYDDCLLPTLQNSYHSHRELFRVFNQHIKKISKKDIKLCPIT